MKKILFLLLSISVFGQFGYQGGGGGNQFSLKNYVLGAATNKILYSNDTTVSYFFGTTYDAYPISNVTRKMVLEFNNGTFEDGMFIRNLNAISASLLQLKSWNGNHYMQLRQNGGATSGSIFGYFRNYPIAELVIEGQAFTLHTKDDKAMRFGTFSNSYTDPQIYLGDQATDSRCVGINTRDLDGNPARGSLTVKGSTTDGSTNVLVLRNSLDTNIVAVTTSGDIWSDSLTTKSQARWLETNATITLCTGKAGWIEVSYGDGLDYSVIYFNTTGTLTQPVFGTGEIILTDTGTGLSVYYSSGTYYIKNRKATRQRVAYKLNTYTP